MVYIIMLVLNNYITLNQFNRNAIVGFHIQCTCIYTCITVLLLDDKTTLCINFT